MNDKTLSARLRLLFLDGTSVWLVLLIVAVCCLDVLAYRAASPASSTTFLSPQFVPELKNYMMAADALFVLVILVSMAKISQIWRLLYFELGDSASRTPYWAVRLLCLPFFNIYWMFTVYCDMCTDANKLLPAKDKVPLWPFMFFCLLNLPLFILFWVPKRGFEYMEKAETPLQIAAHAERAFMMNGLIHFVCLVSYLLMLYSMNKIWRGIVVHASRAPRVEVEVRISSL